MKRLAHSLLIRWHIDVAVWWQFHAISVCLKPYARRPCAAPLDEWP